MDFAVIGGDMRQVKLAELLAADGHSVRTAAMGETRASGALECPSVREAVEGVQCVILPLPATMAGELLNAPMDKGVTGLDVLMGCIRPDQLLLGGKAGGELASMADERGIRFIDYFDREELTVRNAAATAEGAVQLLMEELPVTVSGLKCLVVGFGRIGKLLAMKLKALGAEVTVSARKCGDLAWIEAIGCRAVRTDSLAGVIGGFDAVVNTVPARVIGREALERVGDGCLLLDLASKPGGIDFEAASSLGIKAIWALSLPGRVAPVTSGMAIREAVYNIIAELECGS